MQVGEVLLQELEHALRRADALLLLLAAQRADELRELRPAVDLRVRIETRSKSKLN